MRRFVILTCLLAGVLVLSTCVPVPAATTPPTTAPEATTLPTTAPAATTLPTTVPAATTPPTTVPAATTLPTTAPAASLPPMSIDQAYHIAAASECAQAGQLVQPMVYNENTGTWWIGLTAEKPGCNPACVVDVKTKTAEINWRCTGLAQPTQSSGVAPSNDAGLSNPASVNCEKQGGALSIEMGPDGGQFGVCVFPDGKQCEEWAMFRGECPVGGVDVKGYATEAGRYCAITGGTYVAMANQGTPQEEGACGYKSK